MEEERNEKKEEEKDPMAALKRMHSILIGEPVTAAYIPTKLMDPTSAPVAIDPN